MNSFLEKFFILEGVLLAIIGVLFFTNPIGSFLNFTTICGDLIIIASIVRFIRAFKSNSKSYYIITAIIDFIFGLIIWFNPVSTTAMLVFTFGIWIFIKGIYDIIMEVKLKRFGFNVQSMMSIIAVILGGIVFISPYVVVFVLPYVPYILGISFLVVAFYELYIGFKL